MDWSGFEPAVLGGRLPAPKEKSAWSMLKTWFIGLQNLINWTKLMYLPLEKNPGSNPVDGPKGHQMARRAISWPAGPMSNFLQTDHRTLFGHITQSSEPSRRLGSEVLRVSVSPRGHGAKSFDHFHIFIHFWLLLPAISAVFGFLGGNLAYFLFWPLFDHSSTLKGG